MSTPANVQSLLPIMGGKAATPVYTPQDDEKAEAIAKWLDVAGKS